MILDKIKRLTQKLKGKLPGLEAQVEMAPHLKDIDLIKYFDKKNLVKSRPSGVLILIYPHKNELYIPLMLRPQYGGTHGGQVSFPGGKMEDIDGSLTDTALREAEEELGIPASKVKILGTMSELFISASNFNVLPVVGYLDHRPDFRIDKREVDQVIETPISILADNGIIKEKPIRVSTGHLLQAPYYDVNNQTVWGATAMMLSEFLAIYKDL